MIEAIINHKSVRKFKDQEIDDNTLEQILNAACRAPTGSNLQSYSIIVTKDQARKNTLSDIHYNSKMIETAPITLTFCADLNRIKRWCQLKGEDVDFYNEWGLYLATADTWLAVQNAIIAANSLKLGSCLIGSTFHRSIPLIDFFELPKGTLPLTTLILGHPDEIKEPRVRLPLKAIIHQETYQKPDDNQLLDLYKEKSETLWTNLTNVPQFANDLKLKDVTSLVQLYSKIKFNQNDTKSHSTNWSSSISKQFSKGIK